MANEGRYQSVFRPDLFAGRLVLVTGGGTGIGRCTAHELASLGALVVIAGRREEPLRRTSDEIAAAGGTCDSVLLDIRDEETVERAVSTVVSRHGPIHGLLNNAGGQFMALADQISPRAWRSVVDLNLNGTFIVSRAVYDHSMKEHGGAIVNTLADIWTGYPGMAHMGAARAGIENMTRTLALEWSGCGIRVNCVAPGTILSEGILSYPEEIQRRSVDEVQDIPASRLGTESEISAVSVFLLSPAASYITGETVKADGGSCYQKGRLIRVGRHRRMPSWNGFHLTPDFSGTPFEDA